MSFSIEVKDSNVDITEWMKLLRILLGRFQIKVYLDYGVLEESNKEFCEIEFRGEAEEGYERRFRKSLNPKFYETKAKLYQASITSDDNFISYLTILLKDIGIRVEFDPDDLTLRFSSEDDSYPKNISFIIYEILYILDK